MKELPKTIGKYVSTTFSSKKIFESSKMGYDEKLKNIELVNKENNSQGKTDKNESKKRLLYINLMYIKHVRGMVRRVCRGFLKFF